MKYLILARKQRDIDFICKRRSKDRPSLTIQYFQPIALKEIVILAVQLEFFPWIGKIQIG